MGAPLAQFRDVEDLWRPLASSDEVARVARLIDKASALLRQLVPAIDDRITLSTTDPTSRRALDPLVVADVVATAVKNHLANPEGRVQTSQAAGPFSETAMYVGRGEVSGPRGELGFTASLLAKLQPTVPLSEASRSIRTKPAMAPWPLGRYGGPNPFGSDCPDQIVPVTYGADGSLDASVPHPYDDRI